MDPRATVDRLIALALDPSAAPGEASNAAMAAVRLIKNHRLLAQAHSGNFSNIPSWADVSPKARPRPHNHSDYDPYRDLWERAYGKPGSSPRYRAPPDGAWTKYGLRAGTRCVGCADRIEYGDKCYIPGLHVGEAYTDRTRVWCKDCG